MAYHMYTTEGIILKHLPVDEGSSRLFVLTEKLGLVVATARSSRLATSKLRSGLTEYSRSTVSCIRGKNGWKLTSSIPKHNYFWELSPSARVALARMSSVVLKMVQGEESHAQLFTVLEEAIAVLATLPADRVADLECLAVLRILCVLGYVDRTGEAARFVDDMSDWSEPLLGAVRDQRPRLVSLINAGFSASHL